jgi:diacylglycerol kinase family enzyme
MSRMDARLKRRFGYALYLIEAFRIWATHNFPLFQVTSVGHGGGPVRQLDASQLLAVRVRSFGGALRELAPGAAVGNGSLCLLAFCTRSRIKMLRFLLAVLFRRHTFNGAIEVLDADSVECELKPPGATLVFVEADGEVLGQLPARIEVVRDALTLLIPRNAQP